MWFNSDEPPPQAPQHRPVWHRFRRRCTCGLSWPCQDSGWQPDTPIPGEPRAYRPARNGPAATRDNPPADTGLP
jgi:hypothetical protein